ncbi:hypothetical protein Cni_G07461 [Canna indica]|uniref:Protein unc-13 homolog n=1 Tax=Canna indica TaxID=4628 RepID=A0AAQ3JYI5_9LILI|nr:hypothetical protein Cni_G07461 [Canna indica]
MHLRIASPFVSLRLLPFSLPPPPTDLESMTRHLSLTSISYTDAGDLDPDPDGDLEREFECPFGRIDSLGRADLREAAYEIFFTCCRSSPGFVGSRSSLNYYPASHTGGEGYSKSWGSSAGMTVTRSRIKKALGLNARRSSPLTTGMTSGSYSPGRTRRPMTSAEIMRQQMRVTRQSDHRMRKTLTRALVGQAGKKAETIILPLELLRQLKPSEFSDMKEYHQWQRRQLKIIEAGLLHYPRHPVERQNPAALLLQEVIRSSEFKPLDTSKNSEAMRSLCNSVAALAGRGPGEVCHWVDGYPLNVLLYLALLHSVFDLREETVVLDEVDELVELMKKTWATLGINRMIHNVCFTWLFFRQYIETGEIEPDLMSATLAMLVEVAHDVKKSEREANYVKLLSDTLRVMQSWAEMRVLDYHDRFDRDSVSRMEQVVPLAISISKITGDDPSNSPEERVNYYIRSSMRNAFTKIIEKGPSPQEDSIIIEEDDDLTYILLQLAKDTEELALVEKEIFSPVLKKWHPVPTAAATVTIHSCFGIVLRQYLTKITCLTNELVHVLQSAGKLEKLLVQMVVEDSADCEDGGKGIVREMIPYDVDSTIASLLEKWIQERLRTGKECLSRAKETESWMPKSKNEPYAQSAVDLMKVAKVTMDEFFEIPVGTRDHMVGNLEEGLESVFQEYTAFVAACGSKQSYVPSLPPLTRCNQDSSWAKIWKRATIRCGAGTGSMPGRGSAADMHKSRPSTSRGTQRLFIRLNTLHYLLAHLHALDKSLSFFSRNGGPPHSGHLASATRRLSPSYHFGLARPKLQCAIQHVSELAAYRLIFLDMRHLFYEGLYVQSVAEARIHSGVCILKQNLTLLVSILTDRAQPLAVKEVMKAAFEAFLMVLLAGGNDRAFTLVDYDSVVEDFQSLKRVFCSCGEGLVAEGVVEREAEVAEGIVALMALPTERLIEDFSIVACEASGMGFGNGCNNGNGAKVPMPPTTGRWNRADPNTVLRVLCHRNDEVANEFLKRTFQLAKRR